MQEDVLVALETLSATLKAKVPGDYRIQASCPKAEKWDPLSLVCAGREVHLEIQGEGPPAHRLALLWGIAIPLGWTPWDRWPLVSESSHRYHYFGPWACVVDQLAGAGRGEAVWPSLCAAAQCDAGTWQGDHFQERLIQAFLHRLRHNPGPVDGILGPQTQGVLRALGLSKMPLKDALAALKRKIPAEDPAPKKWSQGRVSLDMPFQIHSFGQVQVRRDGRITVKGPGRIVIDV